MAQNFFHSPKSERKISSSVTLLCRAIARRMPECSRFQRIMLRDNDAISTGNECFQLYMTPRLALSDVSPLLTQALD